MGGFCGGSGVSVFKDYRSKFGALFKMIVGFLCLIRAMSGYAVSRHRFLCGRLTRWQDAPSHHKLMRRYDVFKSQVINLFGSFDSLGNVPTTEQDMLGDWLTSLLI